MATGSLQKSLITSSIGLLSFLLLGLIAATFLVQQKTNIEPSAAEIVSNCPSDTEGDCTSLGVKQCSEIFQKVITCQEVKGKDGKRVKCWVRTEDCASKNKQCISGKCGIPENCPYGACNDEKSKKYCTGSQTYKECVYEDKNKDGIFGWCWTSGKARCQKKCENGKCVG